MSSLTPRSDRFEKNYIINGNMDFWQRGISLTSVTSGFLADRFSYNADVTPVDITRQADVPSALTFKSTYSLKVARVSTQTPGANEVSYIKYTIEGNDLRAIRNKAITIAFWVKSTKTGIYCLTLKDSNYDYSYIKEYTINAANTWERKVINITLSDAGGTWLYNNDVGLRIFWMLQAGSNRRGASAGTWFGLGGANTASWATANQVNLFDASNASIQIAQIELLEGTHSDPEFFLAGKDYANELQLCQRYYEKSYGINITPGSSDLEGTEALSITGNIANLGSLMKLQYKVRKRATATVSTWSATGQVNRLSDGNLSDLANGTVFIGSAYETGARVSNQSGATITPPAFNTAYFHWTADAEL